MNAQKFTPGPWRIVVPQFGCDEIRCADEPHELICEFPYGATEGEDRANASLICAAPDLYQSLLEMVEDSDDVDDGKLPKISAATLTRARQALAKAVTP